MPWTVEYVAEREMILVTQNGEIFNQDARAQAKQAIALLHQTRGDFVLMDFSEGRLEVSLANLYWLPDYYSELDAPPHVRLAVVLPRTRNNLEAFQFYQVACRNAGYSVRLFDTREAAEAWHQQYYPRPQLQQHGP